MSYILDRSFPREVKKVQENNIPLVIAGGKKLPEKEALPLL